MKRICIVRHNYYPDEAHVRRDAETLVEHGYEVDVVCLRKEGQKKHESVRGVNVYRIRMEHHRSGIARYMLEYSWFLAMACCTVCWLFFKRRYKVVQVISMPEVLILTALLPKLFGARVALYVFDHTPEVYSESFGVALDNRVVRLLRIVSKVCLSLADHIIVAEFRSQKITESRGISSSKVSVVLNVPDENIFAAPPCCCKSEENFCLMTHGSLLERYGVQTLIRAVPLLLKDIPELKVMIVGEGEYQHQLEDLAHSLGVNNYVYFTGLVPFEEVPLLIAQADIGIVPTLVPMLPNKLFEYLALRKPVVVATSPSIEAYFDDSSLMLYEPDDEYALANCIIELYRNPQTRVALAASGSSVYQKYRWSTMKYEYLKVFKRLTARTKSLRKINSY